MNNNKKDVEKIGRLSIFMTPIVQNDFFGHRLGSQKYNGNSSNKNKFDEFWMCKFQKEKLLAQSISMLKHLKYSLYLLFP